MINTVIIDDEQNNIDGLSILLSQYCPQVLVMGAASDGSKGKQLIQTHRPGLIFLDIQMPNINGFELLQSISNYDFEVIFVTAYDKYAIQAIKFSAIDYLLKPITPDDLLTAVCKAEKKILLKQQNLQLENLLQLLQHQQSKELHRIALPNIKETRFVSPQTIIRCESSNNYCTCYFSSGEKLLVSKSMSEFEMLLVDYGFIRCQQSHLVNKAFVKTWVKGDGGYMILEDGSHIPVSRYKREYVKEKLSNSAK